MMNRVSLQQLEALLWIAKLGTFAAAADRLHTSQPAISNRIRELEARLGTKLFERQGRQSVLTPRARKVVQSLESFFDDMEASLHPIIGDGDLIGIARIGTGEIAAATCLPPYCASINREMPDVALEIDIALSANLLKDLLIAQTDISFMAGPVAHPSLLIEQIGSVALTWVGTPALVERLVTRDQLEDANIWSLSQGSPIYQLMRDSIAEAGLRARRLNICSNVKLMIDILSNGGGIGLVPEPMVRPVLDAGDLQLVPARLRQPRLPFFVAMRKHERDPLILNLFDRALRLKI